MTSDPVQTFAGLGVVGALLALTLRLMVRNDSATWRLMGDARVERDLCAKELAEVRARLAVLEHQCVELQLTLAALGHRNEGDGR